MFAMVRPSKNSSSTQTDLHQIGPNRRPSIRHLRPTLAHPRRLPPPRPRPHDGLHLERILPSPPLARRLQLNGRLRNLPAIHERPPKLVQTEARARLRDRLNGFQSRGRYLPDHG